MKIKFKPSDFMSELLYCCHGDYCKDDEKHELELAENAAALANSRLEEMLKDVWVYYGASLSVQGHDCWHPVREPEDTHKVKLAWLEELKHGK